MSIDLLGLVHRFEPGVATVQPLLLLHGTGGDEADLLPLGRAVAPGAALLSPRGAVMENGMLRFFRRIAEGVFDEADLRRRAMDLAAFVATAREAYGLPPLLALGFSNGANIAAATILLHPDVFAGAVLIRPMMPFTDPPLPDLSGKPVLMLSGTADPIVPAANVQRLARLLIEAGADVDHRALPVGHALSNADVTAVRSWIGSQPAPRQVQVP